MGEASVICRGVARITDAFLYFISKMIMNLFVLLTVEKKKAVKKEERG